MAETFVSVQGEGMLTGAPSWFVRLSGCNLRCAWCDTPYASWRPEGAMQSLDEIARAARGVWERGIRSAVLTGGEPMMFASLPELTQRLKSDGLDFHITIETAGTIAPPGWDATPGLLCDLMSVSPKLSNSTPREGALGAWADRHEIRRLNVGVLQALLDRYPSGRRQLKFVFADEADLEEIDRLLQGLRGWERTDVMLMPEGTPPTRERMQRTVRACVSRGWRYCHRVHQDVFGNVRGT